ncbi:MAG: methyltransferase domain-containing protein [Candidatus Acidiferrales bacterium]
MTPTDQQRQKALIRDRFTQTVDAFADYAVSYRAQFADSLARLVSAQPTDSAVDLACGPGTLALQFARQVRWVHAVDLTPAMLARARRTAEGDGLGNLSFTLGDAQSLPFAAASLDISVTSYSLHHVPDPARMILEMARVVKRDGRVGIIDIVVPEDPARAEIANRIEIRRDPSHTRSLTRSDFEKMLAAAGLRILASEVHEIPRSFDHWMHVAGWHRDDRAYIETRRLMESTMADDRAGFHPQFAPPNPDAPPSSRNEAPDINMVNTALFIAAGKN